MTSDINITAATVVAIQGKAVSTTAPTDGYVLTWNTTGDGYWEPKPAQVTGLRKEYFTSNGSWVCPAGVTNILVIAAGGGGGGGGASLSAQARSGGGGGGAIQQTQYITVVPSTTYTITIGSGGAGGAGGMNPTLGSDGSVTTITVISTVYFSTLGAGGAGGNVSFTNPVMSGAPFSGIQSVGWTSFNGSSESSRLPLLPGSGGYGMGSNSPQNNGMKNYIGGYNGGSTGSGTGGAGGGAGPQGAGGDGGAGSGANGTNGSSAAANSAAGGGGGGCGSSSSTSGDGGNGGSGYLYIVY